MNNRTKVIVVLSVILSGEKTKRGRATPYFPSCPPLLKRLFSLLKASKHRKKYPFCGDFFESGMDRSSIQPHIIPTHSSRPNISSADMCVMSASPQTARFERSALLCCRRRMLCSMERSAISLYICTFFVCPIR